MKVCAATFKLIKIKRLCSQEKKSKKQQIIPYKQQPQVIRRSKCSNPNPMTQIFYTVKEHIALYCFNIKKSNSMKERRITYKDLSENLQNLRNRLGSVLALVFPHVYSHTTFSILYQSI